MSRMNQKFNSTKDSEKKGKQDLIIAVISVFLLISVLLIVGCCFIHYKLMTTDMTMIKETKSVAIKTHHVETMVLLSPPQAVPPTTSPQKLPQLPAASTPSPRSTPSPKRIPAQLSISHIYSSHSSESLRSDKLGSISSVDHFSQPARSPRSPSRESLDSKGSEAEEQGESSESESIILFAIQDM